MTAKQQQEVSQLTVAGDTHAKMALMQEEHGNTKLAEDSRRLSANRYLAARYLKDFPEVGIVAAIDYADTQEV